MQRAEELKVDEAKNMKIDVGEMERRDEVQNSWQNGSDELVSLKSGLGGTVAKMERAQQANGVLDGR